VTDKPVIDWTSFNQKFDDSPQAAREMGLGGYGTRLVPVATMQAELDALRLDYISAVGQAQTALEERDALRAEVERLRDSCVLDSEGRPLTICHKLATARAEVERLRATLLHLRDACRNNPAMQGREYDGLGIEVNDALRASAAQEAVR